MYTLCIHVRITLFMLHCLYYAVYTILYILCIYIYTLLH